MGPPLFFFLFFSLLFPLISSTLLTDVSVPNKKKKKEFNLPETVAYSAGLSSRPNHGTSG